MHRKKNFKNKNYLLPTWSSEQPILQSVSFTASICSTSRTRIVWQSHYIKKQNVKISILFIVVMRLAIQAVSLAGLQACPNTKGNKCFKIINKALLRRRRVNLFTCSRVECTNHEVIAQPTKKWYASHDLTIDFGIMSCATYSGIILEEQKWDFSMS